MKKIVTLFFLLIYLNSNSQIGAEAQGGKAGMWIALGIDQAISTKWTSVTDLGYGRHSDPNNFLLMKRLGLNVLTQDFVYKKNEHWQHAISFGYWKRNAYLDQAPYDLREIPFQFRNELRPYYKLKYNYKINSIEASHTFRVDNRFYFNQNFSDAWTTPFEFRLRFMETFKFQLSKNKRNFIVLVDEILSAADKKSTAGSYLVNTNWTKYQLTENRFSVYYKRTFLNNKIDLDLGIMHQYWRDKPGENNFNTSVNFMVDLIIKDPFGERTKK